MPYFEKLHKRHKTKFYYSRLLICYKEQSQLKEAEKLVSKQAKKFPQDNSYVLDLGKIYEQTERNSDAIRLYEDLIKDMPPISYEVTKLSTEFKNSGKYDLAFQALQRGRKILGQKYNLNLYFADLYSIQGKNDLMIDEYFDLVDIQPNYKNTIETLLSRQFDFTEDNKEIDLLRVKILERIRKHPSDTKYDEFLIWFFIQKKDFNSAYIQSKALDKKSKGMGRDVFNLGSIAMSNQAYSVARKSYQYVADLGEKSSLSGLAQNKLLRVSYMELTTKRNFSSAELTKVIATYETGVLGLNKNKKAIPVLMEYAEILTYYGNQPEKAKTLLEDALTYPGVPMILNAEVKLLLGDVHIVLNEIWDASVLYLQVENDFKHDRLGHEAKFKNAKVYYYDGDFKWAQAQLDVLKNSTTKLIANDALKLSLLITDNLGLDSVLAPMQLYAKADLLIQQRKYTAAFTTLDSIAMVNPFHGLNDEILMAKAKAYEQQGKWELALEKYGNIYSNHGDDILADDALYSIASIYENHLHNKELAKENYRKILFEYKGSLYTTEARKKFTELTSESKTTKNTPQ
jgi:tetratricopeptide (TPR) repeat protein